MSATQEKQQNGSSDLRKGEIMSRPNNTNAVRSGAWVSNPLVVLECSRCAALDNCPKAMEEADGRCWYERHGETPDLKTADGILTALRQKVELDQIRYQRSVRYQTARGVQAVDRDTTSLSNALTRDLQILAELSVRFGFMEATKNKLLDDNRGVHITADQVNLLQITSEELAKCRELGDELSQLKKQVSEMSSMPMPLTSTKRQ